MSSSTPHFAIDKDDDDGIDWEAAVKEIDIACQRASSASTSRVEEPQRLVVNPPPRSRPICATKQSTLDWFVEKGKRRLSVENGPTEDEGFVGEEGRDEASVCCSEIDLEAAKTWIYPDNIPRRAYQRSITETALFTNTMVALPTGLGKTLIAAVVMYNYFRWFPKGKIVFTAPSRPLVMQQIEACHNIMGIPQEWTIDMTGQLSPSKRAIFWKDKRVFFVTPQVLEKDIQSGTCLVKHLVCLVIDEAHRAMGNYSYCVAVRELMSVPVQFRILALTATPGSKQLAIQNVINNLHISKLEYRDESDHEVSPYVNDRKLELITVAMGNDATEINKMIFEAILPFVTRLSALRVLPSRDYQSLSPCDLLNSRDRFRQAPPQDLPQVKYGEVEGYFGVLITLYHIRKLLSSHGIRPAYEMLEEKLQQGSFARLMSRNEVIWKAKLLMQQSLSHGAPSPKLSKMMEILIDHFKANDPKNSRVIIFSNFRGSVRDIMDSLSSIGELVKATEFIGQSSGKILKGQSQKVQQAVLQKFRSGGYNVIVATSIGEEGLDIMEVDLVICFDANISPLRMIQRMGRTGRKNDGRVVVLACEGTELKGYMRKQASSKSIRKHMLNGGISSFNFHSSPRMIPHICRPEVKYVEMSIEQFIPRSKVKDDSVPRPTFKEKLSYKESELIAKFFHSSGEYSWKPSLIAFPHFQTFPSKVHKIMHSFRTGMLIDSMQRLQGLSFSNDGKSLPVEVHTKAPSSQCLGAETTAQDDMCENDLKIFSNSPIENSLGRIADHDASATVVLNCAKKHQVPDLHDRIPSTHFFLFGTDFVSVNAFGVVSIASVPNLPCTNDPPCKRVTTNNTELLNSVKQNSFPSRTSCGDKGELDVQTKANLTNPAELRGTNHNIILSPRLCNSDAQRDETLDEVDGMVLLTPSPKRNDVSSDEHVVETPASPRKAFPVSLPDESAREYKDIDMSPRLTNLVEDGVVPESPLADSGGCLEEHKLCKYDSLEQVNHGSISNCPIELQGTELPPLNTLHSAKQRSCEVKNLSFSPVLASPASRNDLLSKHAKPEDAENIKACSSTGAKGCMSASINKEIHTPAANMYVCAKAREHISDSPANEEIHTPLVNLTNNCSADWYMSSGEASKSIAQVPKFKRLRKNVESSKRIFSKTTNGNINGLAANTSRCCATTRPSRMKHMRAKRRLDTHMFIEVEAEVSSDAEVSDDEEEDKENDSSDDSFIDDRLNPTLANTQTEAAGVDMMAVYRRSLLTQSPMEIQSRFSTKFSPGVMPSSRTKSDETGSCTSGKISNSLQTPQTGLHSSNRSLDGCSTSFQRSTNDVSLATLHGETSVTKEQKFDSRKRKLSYHQVGYGPESSLQPQRLFHSDDAGQQLLLVQSGTNGLNADVFSDDQFYQDLDLDALEAEATKLLEAKRSKAHNPTTHEKFDLLSSPSFDLGL